MERPFDVCRASTGAVDMRDPAFRDDPHSILHALRQSGRLTRDVMGVWLFCHHADVSLGLRSPHLSREHRRSPVYREHRPFLADSTLERTAEQWMLMNDPPKHTRLRRLASSAFKPPIVAALRDRITAVADELLATLPAQGEFDLMAYFAQPLPVRVICDVLGLPPDDFQQTKAWSDALALILEPVSRREQRAAANRAAEEMVAYLRRQIARRRAHAKADDLLSLLIGAEDDGSLSDDELLGNLVLLFIAGHETTANLIGNGMLTLLRHPDELERLRAQPSLTPGAVEEALRYEGSVNMVSRFTVEPYPVGEIVIQPEQMLYFMIGAANRDPAAFAEPDRFDIGRAPNRHLAFGAGIHFCLGAPLARLEGEIAFTRLLARYSDLRLADPTPRWRNLINLRGLEALRLVGGTAGRSALPAS